jgi:NADPH2:quinone reductase
VLAGVSSPARYDLAKAAGADAMIDLSQPNLKDSLRDQVNAATGGKGADVVLDPLGDDIFDAALRAVAWRGRVVVIGFAAGRIPSVKVNYLMVKNIEVSGLQVSDYRKRRPEQVVQCYQEVFGWFEQGRIAPPPVTTMPLDEFKTALRQIETRKASGRIVLLPR